MPNIYDLLNGEPSFSTNQREGDANIEVLNDIKINNAAKKITSNVSIPTIGIGASVECNGQILVTDDMLGLTYSLYRSKILRKPKFVKEYNKFFHNFLLVLEFDQYL